MILFFPVLILMVAAAISDVGDRLQGARLLASALLVLMAVGVMGFEDNFRDVIQAASDFEERDYAALTAQIQASIPAGSKVVGPPLFWIGLNRAAVLPGLRRLLRLGADPARAQRHLAAVRRRDPPGVRRSSTRRRSRTWSTTSPRYLESNAELVASFRHVNYTRVEVWKMREAPR